MQNLINGAQEKLGGDETTGSSQQANKFARLVVPSTSTFLLFYKSGYNLLGR